MSVQDMIDELKKLPPEARIEFEARMRSMWPPKVELDKIVALPSPKIIFVQK